MEPTSGIVIPINMKDERKSKLKIPRQRKQTRDVDELERAKCVNESCIIDEVNC